MNRVVNSCYRLLIVEDNRERIALFKSWLPDYVVPVIANGAGRALGILNRDKGDVYFGIMLDHDLDEQPTTETDRFFSGTDVVDVVIQNVDIDTPMLIHSMNSFRAQQMERKLDSQGFDVRRIPMVYLDQQYLLEWIKESIEIWNMLHAR